MYFDTIKLTMSNEKIIRIWGGLGNQLFQYAFGKFLEKNYNYHIKFNLNWFKQQKHRKFLLNELLVFKNELVYEDDTFIDKIQNYKTENLYTYLVKKKIFLPTKKLIGYWQDLNFAEEININDFKKGFLSNNILNKEKYYVLHFRGGDFFKSKDHSVLDVDYYRKCLEIFNDSKIYCLTDDEKNLNEILEKLDNDNLKILNLSELDAFRTIVNSEGGIASNSTFCWWAAFLSKKKNWIFPKKWLKNKKLINQNLFIEGTLIL